MLIGRDALLDCGDDCGDDCGHLRVMSRVMSAEPE